MVIIIYLKADTIYKKKCIYYNRFVNRNQNYLLYAFIKHLRDQENIGSKITCFFVNSKKEEDFREIIKELCTLNNIESKFFQFLVCFRFIIASV